MFAKATIGAIFAGLAAAQRNPVGDPTGNPISRPLNEIVPACKAFTITWQPTTPSTVSLILLRGPSTNVVPLQNIVVGIPNSGSYAWSPPSTLEATTTATGYGIQLIDDITGEYQYSTQFGISKGDECNAVVSSGSIPLSSSTPVTQSSKPASNPVASSGASNTKIVTKPHPVAVGTDAPTPNSSIAHATGLFTIPSSLIANATSVPSATRSTLPESTGTASNLRVGFGLAGTVAAFACMV